MNKLTKELLERLPKKYHNRVDKIEAEDDLCDDKPYMLYLAEGWSFDCEGWATWPVSNITEAIKAIKDASPYKE